MVEEPKYSSNMSPLERFYGRKRNPYEGRWLWYYDAIADWMIANPGGDLHDCAKHIKRHYHTVQQIVRSDTFRDFFRRRREEFREHHDATIISRTTKVAEKALDLMLDKMESQADKIPMKMLTEIAQTSLDRLGYGPKQEPPKVEVNVDSRSVVMVPISAAALEEARDAIRTAEKQRTIESRERLELEAEPKPPPSGGEARSEGHDPTS
jgi:hypothetical protein